MKLLKVLMIGVVVLLTSACTCKIRAGSIGNVPPVDGGGPLADIHFDFDRSELSASARETLQMNADWLKEHPDAKVTIEGHCDERGTEEYNLALGQRRAQAAYDYLVGLGIPNQTMSTVSYGESQPLDPRSTEEAWARNRRDHFRVAE